MLPKTVDVGIVRKARLDTQILGLEDDGVRRSREEDLLVRCAIDGECERQGGVIESNFRIFGVDTTLSLRARQNFLRYLIARRGWVGNLDMDARLWGIAMSDEDSANRRVDLLVSYVTSSLSFSMSAP